MVVRVHPPQPNNGEKVITLVEPLLYLATYSLSGETMKLTELNLLDTENRLRLYNIYSCEICGIFYKKQARLACGATQEHYCTKTCYTTSQKVNTHTLVICAHCGVDFQKLNSKLSNSKSGLYFCCRKHKDLGQKYIKEIQPSHYGLGNGKYDYREKALSVLGTVCNKCGYCDNKLALDVHHKDRNRENNSIDNLEVLCANCHAIEHRG